MNQIRFITLRSLKTRPLRTVLSTFGIILGVACLLAVRLTNLTALAAITALFEDTSGKSDLVILNAVSEEAGFEADIIQRTRAQPGVTLAAPLLQVRSSLGENLSAGDIGLSLFGSDLGGLLLFGIDPTIDGLVRGYSLAAGDFLSPDLAGGEILLGEQVAEDHDLSVGDEVALLTPEGVRGLKLVGLLQREGVGQINNGAVGAIPLETAQTFFNRPDELDQIDLLIDQGLSQGNGVEGIIVDLQARLGEQFTVTYPASQGRRVAQMLDGYQIGLNFLSGMALFVGAFLIYNAFSMTVVERTREFGFMRTIGMTRSQVVGQMLAEASLLGFAGAVLGVLAGLGLAQGLIGFLANLLDQEALSLQVSQDILLSSMVVGISVTVLAAGIPAYQASRISPLEALRIRGRQKPGWLLRHGWIAGVGLLALAAVILIRNPFPYDVQFRLGSVTVFALFVGASLVIPASVTVWERLFQPLVKGLFGNSGRLGSSNLQRSKLRTTLTVAALMVGVAMILVTRGMTNSFRGDLEIWIDAYIGGDLFVSSSVPMRSRVQRHLESVEGVAATAPIRYLSTQWDRPDGGSETLTFMAVDPAAYSRVTSFVFSDSQQDPQAALNRLAAGNAIFLSSVLAEKYKLSVGDSLRLRTRSGVHEFQVAAVVVDFYNQGKVIQGSWGDLRRFFRINDADIYLLKVAPGYSPAEVQGRIEAEFGKRDHLNLASNQTIIEGALGLLRQSYILFDALALIAMLVAGLGVVNTLTMNVMERTQEIGMLRSVGMTRRQVVKMILAEASLMGIIGGAFGLIFGVVLTRIFLWSMTAMSGYKLTFVLPMVAIGIGWLIALVVSQLAALLPARRAARIQILEAIQYE